MGLATGTSCVEIVNCLLEDHQALRERIGSLRDRQNQDQGRALEELASRLTAHTQAEEEVLLSRALELDETRVVAMMMLEEHEIADLMVDRAKHSAQDEQRAARLSVLCDLVERHLDMTERDLFPRIRTILSAEEREEMGMRYRETKSRNELAPVFQMPVRESLLQSQAGRVGYIIAWLLGVPVWILILIFLVRGH